MRFVALGATLGTMRCDMIPTPTWPEQLGAERPRLVPLSARLTGDPTAADTPRVLSVVRR